MCPVRYEVEVGNRESAKMVAGTTDASVLPCAGWHRMSTAGSARRDGVPESCLATSPGSLPSYSSPSMPEPPGWPSSRAASTVGGCGDRFLVVPASATTFSPSMRLRRARRPCGSPA